MNNESVKQKKRSEEAMSINADSMNGILNAYYAWNLAVFSIEKNSRILDIGCGPGLYFNEIMSYSPSFYLATDYSREYVEQTERLFNDTPGCVARQFDLLSPEMPQWMNEKFDYVFCFDVIEHLQDDRLALERLCRISKATGACLLIRVPALQAVYGCNDEVIGHYRRYSMKSLKTVLQDCGYKIDMMRYQNIAGLLPWFIVGRIRKRTLAVSFSEGKLFNYAVPVFKFVENIIPPPLGLSLYAKCMPN